MTVGSHLESPRWNEELDEGLAYDRSLHGAQHQHGPNFEFIGFGETASSHWGRGCRVTHLVLDVGMDPFQHPCTCIFIGQVRVYLWKRWAEGPGYWGHTHGRQQRPG